VPNAKNKQQVELIKTKIAQAESVAVVDYAGTTVNDQVKLRTELRQVGSDMLVTKNTLIDIAIGKGKVSDSLKGMSALVFSNQDPVAGIKALFKFNKDNDRLAIKQGYMPADDKVLSFEELKTLSELPGKNELIAMLLNRLQAPATGLVNVLKASQRDLVQVLKAVSEKPAA
jgi:large subunit ribosomal protein L10